MKIVFVTPAADIRRTFSYRLVDKFYGPRHPITGPLILGAILTRAGHQVEVHEELFADIDFNKIKDADVVGLYIMTSNAERGYKIADYLRSKNHQRVVIGGMHASILPEEALEHADQVVVGEAENVIVDVMEGGIEEKIVYASPVENLDDVPFPDYSLLKTPFNACNVLTSRGCPFSCNFCTTTRMFSPYRKRSPDNVIRELKIHKKMGLKHLCFQDDNFTADRKRAKEILKKMIAHQLLFEETFFYARMDMFEDEELLDLLMRANFRRVFIGIESLNARTLKYVNKRQSLADINQLEEKLKKYKFKLIASFVLGLDHDNREDIKRVVDFAKKINAYQLQPQILTPYVGTPIHDQLEKEGRILTRDWEKYDMMHVVFQPMNATPVVLKREFMGALNSFYSFDSVFKNYQRLGVRDAVIKLLFCVAIKVGTTIGAIRYLGRA